MPNLTGTHEAPLELIRQRVLEAIRDAGVSDAGRRKVVTIVQQRAFDAALQILGDMVTAIEWEEEWVEDFTERGRAAGKAEGAVSAKVTGIMKVLSVRDLHPTKKQLSLLAACRELATLDRWFDRSLIAASAAEVFRD